jgi:hypothetical protein
MYSQVFMYSDDTVSLKAYKDTNTIVPIKRLKAAGVAFGTNIGVWGFDRYVSNAEFAHISFETMKANLRKGFVWDNDVFSTNLFMHPYHGGLYFSAARSNGMNYWQSLPYSIGGSLMWELFMEKEYPSINDLLSTSIGGTGFGEITFRLSDLLIDERTTGLERFGREALITLISPSRGLDRIASKQAWRHSTKRENTLPHVPLKVFASIGNRMIYDKSGSKEDFSTMPCLKAGLFYGNPYDPDNDRPYDYFSFQINSNIFSNQPIIGHVSGIGMLYSDFINLKRDRCQLAWGIFQHYNFIESKSDINNVTLYPFKLSEAVSIGPGFVFKRKIFWGNTLYITGYLSGIILGSSQTDHYNVYHRDYNMGSGFSSKLNFELQVRNILTISLHSEDFRLYTWLGYDPGTSHDLGKGTQGDRSNAGLTLNSLNVNFRISKHLFINMESGYYYRKTNYRYYPDVEHNVFENKMSAGIIF